MKLDARVDFTEVELTEGGPDFDSPTRGTSLGDVPWTVKVDDMLQTTITDDEGALVVPVFGAARLVDGLMTLACRTVFQVPVVPDLLCVLVCVRDGVPQPLYGIRTNVADPCRYFVTKHQATSMAFAEAIGVNMDLWCGKVLEDPLRVGNAVWFNPGGVLWSPAAPRYRVEGLTREAYERWLPTAHTLDVLYRSTRAGLGSVADWCPHFPRAFQPYWEDRLSSFMAPRETTKATFETFGEVVLSSLGSSTNLGTRWLCTLSVLTQAMYTVLALETLGVAYSTEPRCWGVTATSKEWVKYVVHGIEVTVPTCRLRVTLLDVPPCDFEKDTHVRKATMPLFNPLCFSNRKALNWDVTPTSDDDVLAAKYMSIGFDFLEGVFAPFARDFTEQCAKTPMVRHEFYSVVWSVIRSAWETFRGEYYGVKAEPAAEIVDATYVLPL